MHLLARSQKPPAKSIRSTFQSAPISYALQCLVLSERFLSFFLQRRNNKVPDCICNDPYTLSHNSQHGSRDHGPLEDSFWHQCDRHPCNHSNIAAWFQWKQDTRCTGSCQPFLCQEVHSFSKDAEPKLFQIVIIIFCWCQNGMRDVCLSVTILVNDSLAVCANEVIIQLLQQWKVMVWKTSDCCIVSCASILFWRLTKGLHQRM